jgi:hypothetical protein
MQAVIDLTSPGIWSMAISDLTINVAWSESDISYNTSGDTAEWIQEATTLCDPQCAVSQLQNFGSVTFTSMSHTYSGTDEAHQQDDYMTDNQGNIISHPTVAAQSLTVTYGSPPPSSPPITAGIEGTFSSMAVDDSTGDVFVSSTDGVTEFGPTGAFMGFVAARGSFVVGAGRSQTVALTKTSQGRAFFSVPAGASRVGQLAVTLVGGQKSLRKIVLS